ncbi:MAG: 3-phosphoshikimate 1-carboxyvinyltransferase, partial [Anaerolineales bacterium]
MNLMITPGLSINGTYSDLSDPAIPGDKSISHRAALFAGMASGDSHIENFMDSGVTRVLLTALRSLGVVVHLDGTTLFISSPGYQNWKQPDGVIECGNSGTTMRLLAGAIAAAGIPAVLDGSSSLRKRPMNRIITPLQQMGV